ncbi:hypothetical protein BKA67DRAFT_513584 [Truncatella angustata]|uniref:DUF676 domain-containing protein n=1 Tax=Truncatella angustata TaxID=152316 RepID=A0A9P9A2S6_9PEZI|nr:uncharacterized protein BKA67DRAFT_513584 [Truncatella angustata]KAH6658521.1 hypothetical protein BKA67DRAFT_513584 [Truncatella angustata]
MTGPDLVSARHESGQSTSGDNSRASNAEANNASDGTSYVHEKSEAGFAWIDGDVRGTGYNDTFVDIITVPCPGASAVETWTRDALDDGYFTSPPNHPERYPTAKQLPGSSILSPAIDRLLPRATDLWVRQGIRTEINTARVLLYTHRELSDDLTFEQLADDLLDHLCRMREGHHGARPMFFICHSIGGLVVKHALAKAKRSESLRWIIYDSHGVTFFATPHRGSSYMSMPNLRDSIQHLLYLSQPLPRSMSDELRLNHRPLIKLHEEFMDIASEMHIWTFYETIDSQLSGLGVSGMDEVHFSAPLASIKSSLVGSRREQAFSLESEHAKCASFGTRNSRIMDSYLEDLSQAVQKAQNLSAAYVHTPLRLAEHVKLELIGFYDDPDPETISDVRLYVSKHPLNEFLEKGPEKCLSERLNTVSTRPRRGSTASNAAPGRPLSSGGFGHLGVSALGIWSNVQGFGQQIIGGGRHRPDGTPDTQEQAEGPEIVVKRPSITDMRSSASEPVMMPRRGRGLTVPALATPGFHGPSSRSTTLDSEAGNATILRPTSGRADSQVSPRTNESSAPLDAKLAREAVPGLDEQDFDRRTRSRDGRISHASAMQDLTAGFSRPDPTRRKFMWIHLPYTNPHWVKKIFDKLSETQQRNYTNLMRNEYWTDRHVQGRHGQAHASYVRPGCGFIPAEAHSPRPPSPRSSGRSSPALNSPNHLYLYLPYLHFDTYANLIRRRSVLLRRLDHGRARPVPEDVSELSLDMRVIWEFIGHDPPLNTRRTLDQYGYPSLRDTYARDDDQMLYKLTKERVAEPFDRKRTDMLGTRALKEQSPVSPADRFASIVGTVKADLLIKDHRETAAEVEDDILDGNILMVDQLWLWAVDMTTLTTFFPKRESHPTEGPMFQQADLRNSVYNELNGDLTGRCENALDLAAFITLHAITRMTSSLKRFRMQTFRDRIHDSDDSDDTEYEDNRSQSIKQRHKREIEQAERENRENTSALLELRDMDDELKTLCNLFREQTVVVEKMRDLYGKDDLREHTQNGRRYLDEALSRLADYEKQAEDMVVRIAATRTDYEKMLEMVQRKAQVDEVRWSRLQTELASTQNLSVIIFTTFTVIFLPLSFFTSLFGMNTADWAGEDDNNYITLHSIGAISLPSSFALIALALVGAFSSRVQGLVKSTFRALMSGWNGTKDRVERMRSDKHKESKLVNRRVEQERDQLRRRRRERGYDFWETVRLERKSEYQIPELNRKAATRRRLAGKGARRSRWRDQSV